MCERGDSLLLRLSSTATLIGKDLSVDNHLAISQLTCLRVLAITVVPRICTLHQALRAWKLYLSPFPNSEGFPEHPKKAPKKLSSPPPCLAQPFFDQISYIPPASTVLIPKGTSILLMPLEA